MLPNGLGRWVVNRWSWVPGLHPVSGGICFSVVPSSNPRSHFVNSQLVCLPPVGIFNYMTFILKYLFPLFQWHACKLAKLSACIAKCMTTINKIYIHIYVPTLIRTGENWVNNPFTTFFVTVPSQTLFHQQYSGTLI